MQIAIIGAGNVGGALGTRWAEKGHSIRYAVRNPKDDKVQKLIAALKGKAQAATIAEAIRPAEVVVLATPWEGARDAVTAAGNLTGKILIDATNPVNLGMGGLKAGLVLGHDTSGGEQVAAWAPGAKVVKAFNTTGAVNMLNPLYGSQKATMFICGDAADAKATVKKLSDEIGFETIDAGPLRVARLLEPLAMLWIHLAFAQGLGTDFILRVVKRG
jgi:predicted dinucleotide-binding enzyme